MPIAGTDLGKVWQGQEGVGIAEKVSTPQTDTMKQYGFRLKLADLKERQADDKAVQANIYKRTQKPEWWSIHDGELSTAHNELMSETARLMRTKNIKDPFALTDNQDVLAIQKRWNELETMAKTSKDLREYHQKMQDAEFRKTVDDKSFTDFNNWFGQNKITDIVGKGLQPPSIRKKNSIEDFGTYWMPFIKQNGGFEDKDGNEITQEGLSNLISLRYAAPNDDLAAFDQKMLAGLDPQILKALEDEQKKQALQGKQKPLGQIYAENQLWKLAKSQFTPYNETTAIQEAAKTFEDVKTKIENGSITVTKVNNSAEFEQRATTASRNFLLGGSPIAQKALRKYGITANDIQNNTPKAQEAITDFSNKVKLAKKKDYEVAQDELKKWQLDAAKADVKAQNSGGEFIRQLSASAMTNDGNAMVLGIASNVIDLGDNTKVKNVTPSGDGKSLKVEYEVYNIDKGGFVNAPQPVLIDMTNDAVKANIQMRYANKVNEKKGTDINSIQKGITTKGALDNKGAVKQGATKPTSSNTGGMY